MTSFKRYKTQWSLSNGRRIEVDIQVKVSHSNLSLSDLEIDDSLIAEVEEKIERGQLSIMDVSVTALWNGIEGNDHLSGNFVESPLDVEQNVLGCHNMVENACENLVAEMEHLFSKLSEILAK